MVSPAIPDCPDLALARTPLTKSATDDPPSGVFARTIRSVFFPAPRLGTSARTSMAT